MKKYYATIALSTIMVLTACQSKKKTAAPMAAKAPGMMGAPADAKAKISDKIKTSRKHDGLFTLYQDTLSGAMYMLVKKDQLNKEFIYFAYSENGLTDIGANRGAYRDNKIFTIRRYFDRLEFVVENTNYFFNDKSALSKAKDANISPAVVISQKVTAEDAAKGEYLIDATSLFMSESMHPIKPNYPPTVPGYLFFNPGMLNLNKSKYSSVRNYPLNTDVIVDYVFDNPSPFNYGGGGVTDARSVTIRMQHSFIEMPKNDFMPRRDDARVGYFSEHTDDQTSPDVTPYRDYIHRWHLVKKDQTQQLSEPVEPITWWIEKTTPHEFRETIKKAGETWNLAFERIGFKNAVRVLEQPDTATWDAGDIRYNVLRWTSSPEPPFGGYGPSFVNPRTGQILGADIMLEYIFVTNRLKQEKLFDAAAMPLIHDDATPLKGNHFCSIGDHLHNTTSFGSFGLQAMGADVIEVKEYIKESLYYLVLHEMGHTLGLMHNMKASQLWSPSEINNRDKTESMGLTGSVMDYPSVNLSPDKSKQGQYFTKRPGPYDMWAIEYGYSPALPNEEAEEDRLNRILARASEKELAFGNDADDMRSPGKAIDPRVMINDLSSDAISYSVERIKLANSITGKLKEKYIKEGKTYTEMRNAYLIVSGEYATAASVMSRYIGGVYVDRTLPGQNNGNKPYTPVPYAEQKRAMDALKKYAFAPDAMNVMDDLYNYLQLQRRGFNFFGGSEDPKVHDRVIYMQRAVLLHILHPSTLKRMTDSKLYGNKYSVYEMMNDMTNGIFAADLSGNVNSFRQNLQNEYVGMLISVAGLGSTPTSHDHVARHNAMTQLRNIQKMMNANQGSGETASHRAYVSQRIKSALESK